MALVVFAAGNGLSEDDAATGVAAEGGEHDGTLPADAPLMDSAGPEVSDRIVAEEDGAVLKFSRSGGQLSLSFEHPDAIGGAGILGKLREMPALVHASVTEPAEPPTWAYLFGVARKEVARVEVEFSSGAHASAATQEHHEVPELRFFIVPVPEFDVGEQYPTIVAYSTAGERITDSRRVDSAS